MKYNNKVIRAIGIDHLRRFLLEIDTGNYSSVIFLGSGNGYAESFMRDVLSIDNVHAVDPNPNKFSPVPPKLWDKYCLHPTAADISEVDVSSENTLLVLNYPNPNDHIYDVEAILAVRPRGILILCERSGGAGSYSLLWFLHNVCSIRCIFDRVDESLELYQNLRQQKFGLVHGITAQRRTMFDWGTEDMNNLIPSVLYLEKDYAGAAKVDNTNVSISKWLIYPRMCVVCLNCASNRCSICKKTYYCSITCQKKDWKKHKKTH